MWRGKVVEVGVDWLTCTARSENLHSGLLHELGIELLNAERGEGHSVEPSTLQGYKGRMCGGVQIGTRQGEVYLRLSGERAAESWGTAVGLCDNVSRLDLQVTTQLEEPDRNVHLNGQRRLRDARREAAEAKAAGLDLPGRLRGRVPEVARLIDRDPEGATLEIGSRRSASFGRAYDKGAQRMRQRVPPPSSTRSWEPGVWWRYEVELHDEAALANARQLRALTGEEVVAAVRSSVHRWFDTRHMAPRFAAKGAAELLTVKRALTDDERRLLWLREQVGPVIAGLVERGRAADVLAALAESLNPGKAECAA